MVRSPDSGECHWEPFLFLSKLHLFAQFLMAREKQGTMKKRQKLKRCQFSCSNYVQFSTTTSVSLHFTHFPYPSLPALHFSNVVSDHFYKKKKKKTQLLLSDKKDLIQNTFKVRVDQKLEQKCWAKKVSQ